MVEGSTLELTIVFSLVTAFLGTLGFSFAFKDYVASLMAGVIIRKVKQIKPGRRIKILVSPVIKGDIVSTGSLRTTIMEVGDGERLPSVQTGRIIKVPNNFLFNNPVLIYGDMITDEVVAYVKSNPLELDGLIGSMRRAIEEEGHRVVEIGIYPKENFLVIHGIFEASTKEVADLRSRILKRYLEMTKDLN